MGLSGVLAIAFAYICAGGDLCKTKYDHKSIRLQLVNCLESCTLSSFPLLGERRSRGVKHIQVVDLHCSCRMPEEAGDDMAECDACKAWYHRYCQDIPVAVFKGVDVPWICSACSSVPAKNSVK